MRTQLPSGSPLPQDPGGLVGRDEDLAAIHTLVHADAPIVTLLGPAGIGKTRLAVAYAHRHTHGFPGGVFYADLASSGTLEHALAVVARTFGLPALTSDGGGDAVSQLGDVIARRGACLVVLDDFERLLPAGRDVLAAWVSVAPAARFLVTSQERLRLDAEHAYDVDPLSLPEGSEDLARSEAVRLFVARARQVRRDFDPTRVDPRVMIDLVRGLDGIPLALELAAGRMSLLAPEDLLQRLDRRFDLLARRDANAHASDRHATLRRAIDASWSLLSPEEQRTLSACAVFRGGFTIESAERVLDGDANSTTPLLDRLESLRDKSLLVSTLGSAGGSVRLGALQSLAAYATERLAQREDRNAVHARHAAHYLGEASSARPEWLATERENLFAAIEWTLGPGSHSTELHSFALRALLAFERLAYAQGPFTVWVDALRRVAASTEIAPALRMQGLRAVAAACWHVGDLDGALRAADEGLALAPGARDVDAESAIEATRGLTLLSAGRIAASGTALERAASLIRDRDALRESESLRSLAQWFLLQGRHREALERFAMARALAAGTPALEARVMIGTAWVHAARDELDEALALVGEAVALHPADEMFDSWVGVLRSEIEADREQYDRALEQISHSIERAERRHHRRAVTSARGYRGVLLCQLGRWREAREDLAWAARVSSEPRFRALFVAFLAALDAIEGHAVRVDERLDDSMRVLSVEDDPLRAAAAVLGALCMLLRARSLGDGDASRALVSEAKAQLLDVAMRNVGDAPPAGGLYEVRAALRTLERALGPGSLPNEARRSAHGGRASASGSLRIHREADWLALPSGERVSLTSKRVLRRLVLALARERLAAPGRPLTADALIAAGWPGERMLRTAGRNRLKFSIALLRQLGLRDVLRSGSEGYLFDPEVPLAWG